MLKQLQRGTTHRESSVGRLVTMIIINTPKNRTGAREMNFCQRFKTVLSRREVRVLGIGKKKKDVKLFF